MATRLTYVIRFVSDMDAAIAFHRDVLGLAVKFATPFWTEFATGDTTLALHPATPDKPAGTAQVGFGVEDIEAFHADKQAAGLDFRQPPTALHGVRIATLTDCDGAEIQISGP